MLSDEAAKEQLATEMVFAKEPHVAAAVMDESWALLTPILRAMRLAYAAGHSDGASRPRAGVGGFTSF